MSISQRKITNIMLIITQITLLLNIDYFYLSMAIVNEINVYKRDKRP